MTGVGRACPRWSWPVEAISWSWWTAGTGSWSCRPLMRISWWWSVPPLILSWGRTSSPSLTFFTFWVRAPFGTKVQYTVLLWLNGLMVRVPVSTDRPSRVPISVRALPTVWVEGGRSRTVNTVKTQSVRVQILDSAVKKITFFSSWKHHRPTMQTLSCMYSTVTLSFVKSFIHGMKVNPGPVVWAGLPGEPVVVASPSWEPEEGQPVHLTCRAAAGNPPARIHWSVESTAIFHIFSHDFWEERTGTRQVVPYCYRNSKTKFQFEILQGLRACLVFN